MHSAHFTGDRQLDTSGRRLVRLEAGDNLLTLVCAALPAIFLRLGPLHRGTGDLMRPPEGISTGHERSSTTRHFTHRPGSETNV